MPIAPRTLASVLAFATFCQARADKVDDFIQAEMARQSIPGVAVVITKDDKVVKSAAYGVADLVAKTPMKPGMVFEAGSIGKCFTATVIMKLWEQKRIGLDDSVSKYLPDTPALWAPITIRNLLGHTSGLADYAVVESLTLTGNWTTKKWFEEMAKQPLDFPTGSRFAYSNSNYLLLGEIAGKITGKSILDLTQEWVFKPLGMKRSYISDGRAVEAKVKGYWETKPSVVDGLAIPGLYGDGSTMNTPEDLVTFEKGLREGKLLKPETVKMMQTSGRLPNKRRTGYGFAWFIREGYGHKYVTHGGNTGGFGNSITRVVDKNMTVVVMTNLAQVSGDGFAQRIAAAYDPDLVPKPPVESPDPDPQLSARLKSALEALAKGEAKNPAYDKELEEMFTTGRGQMVLEQYAMFKPGIDSFAYCSTEDQDPDSFLRYRVKVGKRSIIVGFVLTADKKILSVALRPES